MIFACYVFYTLVMVRGKRMKKKNKNVFVLSVFEKNITLEKM